MFQDRVYYHKSGDITIPCGVPLVALLLTLLPSISETMILLVSIFIIQFVMVGPFPLVPYLPPRMRLGCILGDGENQVR